MTARHRTAVEIALIVGGLSLWLTLAKVPPSDQWPEFFVLLALAILAGACRLPVPAGDGRDVIPATLAVDCAALLLFGPHLAIPIVGAGAAMHAGVVERSRSPLRIASTVAVAVTALQVSGLAYRLAGGAVRSFDGVGLILPLLALCVAYAILQTGTYTLLKASAGDGPAGWAELLHWSLPGYLIGAAVGAIGAAVIDEGLWILLPVLGIPLYLTHRAYHVYAGRVGDNNRHKNVIESLHEGLAVIDCNGQVTLWNDALERMLQCNRAHALGRSIAQAVPALHVTDLPRALSTALSTGSPQLLDPFSLGRGDTRRMLQVRVLPFHGGATVIWNDVTDRAEAERALKRSEERYALAASGANDGVWDWDLVSGQVYFSARWRSIVGLPSEEGHGTGSDEWFARVPVEDRPALEKALQAHIRGDTDQFQHEHRVVTPDGSVRWVLCRGAAVRNGSGRATRIAGSLTDVTDRAASQERLRHAATHDTLTGLPNRRLFTDLLARSLARRAEMPVHRCAVLFLDMDRFKFVNDNLGHLVADELLVQVSERLRTCLRDGDVLARMGGDEFTMLLHDVQSANQACAVAARIQDAVRAPIVLGGRELFVSASIGVAVSGPDTASPEEIMRNADAAMYRAKARGKARHEVFDADMQAEDRDRLAFENDLRQAVDRDQLVLHYQPIVALHSGAWTGFEALVRWRRGGQTILPSRFIPLAEEIGAVEPIGEWVLRQACQQFATWRRRYPDQPLSGITVNVSPKQLMRPDFVALVGEVIREAKLSRGELRLEITETSLMNRPEAVADVLRELRGLGVQIYLDDFGTGYSSLSHLHRLPVDALKIDRSFVASLRQNDCPAIVESILALARTLDTLVIAEGVETVDQLTELSRLGCRHAQGYLFSRPLDAAGAEELLRTGPDLRRGSRAEPVLANYVSPLPTLKEVAGSRASALLLHVSEAASLPP
ncbi:MAG: putative bifunctional diguanylate cyclase/phosphodiesterase [Acidobacteriota bacterium]